MKCAVVSFPGSNGDMDAVHALSDALGTPAERVWHTETDLSRFDAVVLPGGFSYGDYLRAGAIARFAPVMSAVADFAAAGRPVLGICNGFQVLTEVGLLPGTLVRNAELKFVCRNVPLQVVTTDTPFTHQATRGQILSLPVAHGEGCYVADERTLDELEATDRVVLRYQGHLNGSMRDIAGIVNKDRNVMGMMPHPERAADELVGGTDGLTILGSLVSAASPVSSSLTTSTHE